MHGLIGLSHISSSGDAALVSSYCSAQGTQAADEKRACPATAVACPLLMTLRRVALIAACAAPSSIPEIIPLPRVPWCVQGSMR